MYQNIQVYIQEQIGVIEIYREEVLNALNNECILDIRDALYSFKYDDEVRVVIIKGSGDKAFAAGADIEELQHLDHLDVMTNEGIHDLLNELETFEKPTIAMVNGFALGGGCELTLACDIRIASNNAKFGLPELNLGIIPGAGGTQRLLQHIGLGNTLYLIFTGNMVDAATAQQMGLVSAVVNQQELEKETFNIAKKIISKGPVATKFAKLAIKSQSRAALQNSLLIEKLAQSVLFATQDKQEGMEAFFKKRKPEFKNQ
ncbi:enoyl-CoA hydratase/isomerase family protein [Pseudobacillus sp. FSL P4-0506]|uniref:enoyl-CoA hydratase/isomerase family protein n=1 Tax=unclassified Pseudobacillus TaxID=2619284 RepID=UPI0030F9D997